MIKLPLRDYRAKINTTGLTPPCDSCCHQALSRDLKNKVLTAMAQLRCNTNRVSLERALTRRR